MLWQTDKSMYGKHWINTSYHLNTICAGYISKIYDVKHLFKMT